MLTRFYSYLFFFLFITSISYSQHDGWQNFTDSRNVTGVVNDGNHWWIATTGGLIKINIENGAKTFYSHANSGLPSNHLTCIDINSSNTILWIGTNEGIAVYDYQSWTVYDMDNTPLPSNQITCLDYHESNVVLIGTSAGAVLQVGENWEIYDDVNFYINAVFVEALGNYYVGAGGQVLHYYSQLWSNLDTPVGTRNITAIKKDGSIYLWVSTYGEGIFSWDGYNWTNYDHYNSPFTSDNFTWLDIDEGNNLWAACYGQLWKRTAFGNWEYQYTELNLSVNNVLVINDDFLAVGCSDGFFTIEQPGSFADYVEYDITNSPLEYWSNEEIPGIIKSVFVDIESNDKYLSVGGQIYKFSNLNNHIFSERPFDQNYSIADIITDHLGRVWVCADRANAVSVKGDGSWTQQSNPDDNNNCLLWEPTSEVSGILWVGGEVTGLKSIDDTVWSSYSYNDHGIETSNITDMLLDDNGNTWIVGRHLEEFNGNNTVGYLNEINQLMTNCIAREGNTLWIGSLPYSNALGGITKFDGTNFTNYHSGNSDLPGNSVTKIVVSGNGRKYVGTTEGLAVFDDVNAMTIYTRENSGLPDNNISAMDIDNDGNLWIGTESGGLAILGDVNITAVEEEEIILPTNYILEQNYPNPFNPSTKISFSLLNNTHVKLYIYNSLGQIVRTVVNSNFIAGQYNLDFNASTLSSGVYFYQIITKDFVDTKKMLLIK